MKKLFFFLLLLVTGYLLTVGLATPALAQDPCCAYCCGPGVCANKCDGSFSCNLAAPDCAGASSSGIDIPRYSDISQWVGNFRFIAINPGTVINWLLPRIFALAGILLFLYLLYGGLQILTSIGRPKAIAGGVATLTRAVIGFVTLFLSYWLIQIIEVIFAVNII